MKIPAAVAADLNNLTETLDDPATDITDTVRRLALAAGLAVSSYLGLCVTVSIDGQPVSLAALEDDARHAPIGSSIRMAPALSGFAGDDGRSTVILVLYARTPGAFVDLAADLSWLTGRDLAEFGLDLDLNMPLDVGIGGALNAASTVNQAIGVLIGRGHPPGQAEVELDELARSENVSRLAAATILLAGLETEREDGGGGGDSGGDPIPGRYFMKPTGLIGELG